MEVRVGAKYRYGNPPNDVTVWVMELLPGDKARVVWHTAGRKAAGRRYYTMPPARRERVVRVGSLKEW